MTHQQLTFLDIPESIPHNNFPPENQEACHHQWLRSVDRNGLFCWRCYHCGEKKPADRIRDRSEILTFANKQLKFPI